METLRTEHPLGILLSHNNTRLSNIDKFNSLLERSAAEAFSGLTFTKAKQVKERLPS